MEIKTFFDTRSYTFTYVAYDAVSKDAVVIDPVLDYNPQGSKIFFDSIDEVTAFLKAEDLNVHYIMETHAHADHLSGSRTLAKRFPGAKSGISSAITKVQATFKSVFDLPDDFPVDGRQFDRLFQDGETVTAGTLKFEVIHTPGHTPACSSFKFGDVVFIGDVLFMPDQGSGRCDFPAGSAANMYRSVMDRIYTLPDETRLFTGHDYQPGGREVQWESTVAEQKAKNITLTANTTFEEFVTYREKRDAQLNLPKLIYQSVQVNIGAGKVPFQADGARYLKVPVNIFRPEAEGDDAAYEIGDI